MNLILGCGLTGISIANFLTKKNIKFIVADNRDRPPLAKNLPKCQTIFGKWQKSSLTNISQIISSPGINPNEDIVKWAKSLKINIISDIDLFYQYYKDKTLIGITGSNGKSTTTKMLESVINNSVACGNIGIPILDVADDYDIFIIELSSYQLDITNNTKLNYGLVLNITPDHLDRYGNFEAYKNSKLKIYQISKNNIINKQEQYTKHIPGIIFTNKVPKGQEIGVLRCHNRTYIIQNDKILLDFSAINLLGSHNLENTLAVLTICNELKLNLAKTAKKIQNFKTLVHRLEYLGNGYFNDSKATNSTSTINAINSVLTKYEKITLILGGEIKKENYQKLFNLINEKIDSVILIGKSSNEFAKKIQIKKQFASSLPQVLEFSKNDECILFSPACASFDMFKNFEDRGNIFKKLVNEL